MSSFFNLHNSGFWRTDGDIKDDVFLTIFILLNTVLVFFVLIERWSVTDASTRLLMRLEFKKGHERLV